MAETPENQELQSAALKIIPANGRKEQNPGDELHGEKVSPRGWEGVAFDTIWVVQFFIWGWFNVTTSLKRDFFAEPRRSCRAAVTDGDSLIYRILPGGVSSLHHH